MAERVSETWFEAYAALIAEASRGAQAVEAFVRLESDLDNRIGFSTIDAWSDYVLNNWSAVVETDVWLGASRLRKTQCDYRRLHVYTLVMARDSSEASGLFGDLEQRLQLTRMTVQPYRYRKASAEFEIGRWKPEEFAKGVSATTQVLGGQPFLREAYIKTFDGDVEKLTPFYDLQSFIQFVAKKASRFGEAQVLMEGAEKTIGIRVDSDHKRLRLRSSVTPDALDEFIAVWPDSLLLKPVKAVDAGSDLASATSTSVPEKPLLKYGIPVVIAFITAASVAGFLSLKVAIWPDYRVIIHAPPAEHGVAVVAPGEVLVSWYLKPIQPSLRRPRKDSPATLRLFSDGKIVAHRRLVRAPAMLPLKGGDYVVEVDVADAEPERISLHVVSGGSF